MTTVSSNSVNSDIAVSTTSGTVNKVISSPLTEEITVSSANGNLKILKTESPDDITVGSENALTYLVTEKLTEQEISAGVYKGPKGDDGADGNDGADGAQGIQGEKGDTGDTGPQGDPTTNYLVDNADDSTSGRLTAAGFTASIGGRIKSTTRVTTTYTILVTDSVVFANSDAGSYTVDLPTGVEGQTIRVINSGISTNTITVDGDGTETIYSSLTFALEDNESIEITYNADDGWM